MLNKFSSSAKKLNRVVSQINLNNYVKSDLTGSLMNIQIPNNKTFQSQIRPNPTPNKIINNSNNILQFHNQLFEYSARYVKKSISAFNILNNELIIKNTLLDYNTENVISENFEIFVGGLHIPNDFDVREVENNVVIKLYGNYIDFQNTEPSDVYAFGKFLDVILDTENSIDLLTEDGSKIII